MILFIRRKSVMIYSVSRILCFCVMPQGVFQVTGNADVRISGHQMRQHPVHNSCCSEICISPLQHQAGPSLLVLESLINPTAGASATARVWHLALGRKRGCASPVDTSFQALWVSEKGTSPVLYKMCSKPPEQTFCLQVF